MTDNPNVLIFSSNSKYQKDNKVGGAETSLRLIGEKLADRGINVVYFTNGISRIPGTRRKVIKGVDVYFFTPWRWPLLNNTIFPFLAEKFCTWQKRKALAKIIKKKNISIIHTYAPFPDTFDIIKIREKYNLKFKIAMRVAGLHWTYQLESHSVEPSIIQYIFNNIDIMNYLDIGLKNLFDRKCKEFGIKIIESKNFIHDIGVDLNYYYERKTIPQNDHFTIICASKFSPTQKRQDLLINAINKLKDKNIYVKFAGDGRWLKKYRSQVKRMSLQHMVQFHGPLGKSELRDLMKTADLVVLPTDYEGVSKAVIEAMAMRLPVLVSDVSALNSFLTNNKTGFLVENTVENWVQAILKLSNDRQLLAQVAKAGCRYARDNYNADINIERYIKIFQDR